MRAHRHSTPSAQVVDARRSLLRAVHDHARQHDRERRAALDPARPEGRHLRLEWVVNGYALTFAALMLTGGKLADMLRPAAHLHRRACRSSQLSSLACGLAPNADFLIGARAVQGVGAALMNPATLSIITATFPPRQRGWRSASGLGPRRLRSRSGRSWAGCSRSTSTGAGSSSSTFRSASSAIVAAVSLIDESRDTSLEQRLDLPGSRAPRRLFALTYGLIEANTKGGPPRDPLRCFGVAVLGLAAFVLLERRQRPRCSTLPLQGTATFTGTNVTMMLVALAMFGVFFFVSLFIQNILGYSPVGAGAAFLPMTI